MDEFRKPSEKEEEYIARMEFEKKKRQSSALREKMQAEERDRLRTLHHMRCPKCGMELVEVSFRKVRVDKCSSCAGLFLDAGELDQILAEGAGFFSGLRNVFGGG